MHIEALGLQPAVSSTYRSILLPWILLPVSLSLRELGSLECYILIFYKHKKLMCYFDDTRPGTYNAQICTKLGIRVVQLLNKLTLRGFSSAFPRKFCARSTASEYKFYISDRCVSKTDPKHILRSLKIRFLDSPQQTVSRTYRVCM